MEYFEEASNLKASPVSHGLNYSLDKVKHANNAYLFPSTPESGKYLQQSQPLSDSDNEQHVKSTTSKYSIDENVSLLTKNQNQSVTIELNEKEPFLKET